eukprot:scaffold22678_cov119-Isochrysis_galbana.AAC.1
MLYYDYARSGRLLRSCGGARAHGCVRYNILGLVTESLESIQSSAFDARAATSRRSSRVIAQGPSSPVGGLPLPCPLYLSVSVPICEAHTDVHAVGGTSFAFQNSVYSCVNCVGSARVAPGLIPVGEAVEVGLIYAREEVAEGCRVGVGVCRAHPGGVFDLLASLFGVGVE